MSTAPGRAAPAAVWDPDVRPKEPAPATRPPCCALSPCGFAALDKPRTGCSGDAPPALPPQATGWQQRSPLGRPRRQLARWWAGSSPGCGGGGVPHRAHHPSPSAGSCHVPARAGSWGPSGCRPQKGAVPRKVRGTLEARLGRRWPPQEAWPCRRLWGGERVEPAPLHWGCWGVGAWIPSPQRGAQWIPSPQRDAQRQGLLGLHGHSAPHPCRPSPAQGLRNAPPLPGP